MPFTTACVKVAAQPRDAQAHLVDLVWAHLDFCQHHKPLARLFYALFFGPDDQKELVDLAKYTQRGHELLLAAVDRAIAERLARPDCATIS